MSPSEKRVQELHRAHPVRCLSRGLWRLAYASSLAYASPPHAFSHTDDPSGDGGGYPACSHPHPSQPLAVVGPPSSPDTTSAAISAAFHQPPEPPAHRPSRLRLLRVEHRPSRLRLLRRGQPFESGREPRCGPRFRNAFTKN